MVGRRTGSAVFATVVLLLGSRAALAESTRALSPAAVSVLGIKDARLIRAVSRSVADAAGRLDSEECRLVFSDFSDASGVRLSAKLDAAGQDARSYLGWLHFLNGSREAFCDRGSVALAADPGSRFVTVCGPRFAALEAADPGYAAALVIHEELHALGLGENPPSSAEITARVIARCGR